MEETETEDTKGNEETEEIQPDEKPAVYQPPEKVTEVLISPETEKSKEPSLDFTPDITIQKTAKPKKQIQTKVKKKVTVSKKNKKK